MRQRNRSPVFCGRVQDRLIGVFVVMSSSGGHGRSLRESHRVLTPSGVLIDVRPVTAAIVLELVIATHAVWAKTICTYSAPEDVAAADAAVQLAVTRGWLAFDMSLPFHSRSIAIAPPSYASMPRRENCAGAEIPYEEIEERLRELGAETPAARLRCRRPWMLSTHRKT